MGLALWLFLLLPLLRVPLTLSPSSNLSSERCPAKPSPGSRCGPREYWSGRHCCQCCPAGQYVRKPCSSPHTQGECEACDTGTYTGHANGLPSCQLCTTCRKDQEEVSDCTPTQDRRCQCKTGEYYCDSEHCPEGCYRCTSCPGATLQTCTPTRDTKCAPVAQPEPGPPAGSLSVSALVVSVVAIVIAIAIGIRIAIAWWRRRGVLLPQWLCRFRTATSGEPGSHAILRPTDPVRGPPVPGAEITPLLPEKADTPTPGALTHPRPLANPDSDPDPDPNPDTDLDPDPDPDPDTDLDPDPDPDPDPDTDPDSDPDPGAGAELQVEVAGGGLVAPEAAPPTPAAAAPGAQAQAEMDAGLRH